MIIIKAANTFEGNILPTFPVRGPHGEAGAGGRGTNVVASSPCQFSPPRACHLQFSDPLRAEVRQSQVGVSGRNERQEWQKILNLTIISRLDPGNGKMLKLFTGTVCWLAITGHPLDLWY